MNSTSKKERRKFPRIPVPPSYVQPVTIRFDSPESRHPLPGIVCDLSAQSIAIATFSPIELNSKLIIDINFHDLLVHNIKGSVISIREKEDTFIIVIQFDKPNKLVKDYIESPGT